MLSFETRNRLADLFLSISDGERQIEIVRQILCEQLDFEPYAAFKRIDRSRKGAIDPHDILKFLSENKIHHAIDHCRAFINRYDVDGDGQLVYNEFLCAVLPMDNPTLRTIATQRPNYDVAEDQLLSYDVEYSLSKIIDREITFYTSLEYQKASLHRCPDFDSLLAFSTINPGPGKINYDRLEAFFHKLAVYPSDDELVALLRRLDRDDDGCLTYDEFAIGVQSIDKSLANTINRSHHRSPARTHTSPIKSRVFSPSRTIQTTTSDIEVRSPNRAFIESLRRPASPLRTSNILRSTTSPVLNSSLRKAASPRRLLSPSRVISPGRNAANTATMRFNRSSPLQESYAGYAASRSYIEQERVASPVKFAGKESRSGFGSTAATLKITERASSPFRTTLNNATNRVRGSPLRQSDLVSRSPGMQETLKRSALGESTSGTRMLLKSSEKSILKKNGLYYTMSMSSSDKSQSNFNISARKENKKSSKFESSEAREGLLDTLKQFIQFEKDLEARKQDLALRSDFNLLDFFRVFDVDERGAVSSIEIKEGFERFNVIASKEQLYLFLRRFDRDNDGKLKFSDFAEAFTCKQQEYANLLNNRTPVKGDSGLDLEHPFSESTMSTVAKALRTHLDNEICIEGLRQRLTRRYKFNAHEGFVYLDLKEDGVVTNDEIAEILDKNNCYATQKEVGFVIDRMDINRDGKVTYSEFVQEMTPKSDKSL